MIDDSPAPPQPANRRVKPITVEAMEDGILVTVPAPGVLGEPKVLSLLAGGCLFLALGFGSNAAVWFRCWRDPGISLSDFVAIPVVGLASLLFFGWGWFAFRGAVAAMVGSTRLKLRPGVMILRRSGIPSREREVRKADCKDMMIADQLQTILELSMFLPKSTIISIVSGRSSEELCWLRDLIRGQLKKERRNRDPQAGNASA